MQNNIYFLFILLVACTATAQENIPTVPTAIYVGNAAFHAPVYGAKISLVLQEDFGNKKRPVSTFIGEFISDSAGMITVSLIPNKSYLIQTTKDGYYTQLSKLKTTNFSRTHQNKKGISLRPRNIISIKGNIAIPNGTKGQVTLTNTTTNYTRTEQLDATGNYDIKAVKDNDYELHVFIEGMIDTVVNIKQEALATNSGNIPFVYNFVPNAPKPNYRAGDVFALKSYNLRFIDRTHRLSSEIWLDTLVRILKDNPEVKMELQIHTDSRKSDRLNLLLSKKRAALVQQELIERGVTEEQFFFEMKGEDEILNHCVDGVTCTKREHAINNRIVLIVTSGAFLFKEDD
ncbi:OmpA family protein [Aureispira anguillae]|uniref:OmpA family protein n=1 Tax=Aureispira anguillae TaxID=2864201 RepID=A0A915YI05_9BACT|nr:OmpA family protein [Aureispira anguillae]BDS13336.1 OmpA family protein [Aureispira anguillae]